MISSGSCIQFVHKLLLSILLIRFFIAFRHASFFSVPPTMIRGANSYYHVLIDNTIITILPLTKFVINVFYAWTTAKVFPQ